MGTHEERLRMFWSECCGTLKIKQMNKKSRNYPEDSLHELIQEGTLEEVSKALFIYVARTLESTGCIQKW
jgi:hypothetical protein